MYSVKPFSSPDLDPGSIKNIFLLVNTKVGEKLLGNVSFCASLFSPQLFLNTTNVLTIDQQTEN